ncbi:MAG TPA: transporter [Gemmataceae bacterium]|nr:transporter [Gemmataceae bacterium]
MRSLAMGLLSLMSLTMAARAEVAPWGMQAAPANEAADAVPIRLGRPVPIAAPQEETPAPPMPAFHSSYASPIIRGQSPDVPPVAPPPPPPPPPGGGVPPFPGGLPGGEEPYNCGVVAKESKGIFHGFFSQCWDDTKKWCQNLPSELSGAFQPGAGRGIFQSDHKFDNFISPLTNPFLFEDPRALTEVRPIFMWQQTPSNNPVFHGGDNIFVGAQFRLAITDWLSVVVNKMGGTWMEVHDPVNPAFNSHVGFSELWLGPKITFLRDDSCGTLMAAGVTFQIPTGPASVFQDTGSLSIDPYFSFGQNFLRSFTYGSFNFLNTTGYAFRTDDQRSEYFHTSFHLDFDVGNFHRIYPLVELNWFHYTRNGHPQTLGFEGADLFNFGSNNAGRDDLNIAVGARYKFTENIQMGAGIQWGLLNQVHSLEGFRVTADLIIRY